MWWVVLHSSCYNCTVQSFHYKLFNDVSSTLWRSKHKICMYSDMLAGFITFHDRHIIDFNWILSTMVNERTGRLDADINAITYDLFAFINYCSHKNFPTELINTMNVIWIGSYLIPLHIDLVILLEFRLSTILWWI